MTSYEEHAMLRNSSFVEKLIAESLQSISDEDGVYGFRDAAATSVTVAGSMHSEDDLTRQQSSSSVASDYGGLDTIREGSSSVAFDDDDQLSKIDVMTVIDEREEPPSVTEETKEEDRDGQTKRMSIASPAPSRKQSAPVSRRQSHAQESKNEESRAKDAELSVRGTSQGPQEESTPRDRSDGFFTEDKIEEKVRDNEKYSVFFKMLRMGVPMPAVKNKMIQKAVNPVILDLGEEGSMSRVLALERAYEQELKLAKLPKKKGEVLHWEAIPEDRLANQETIFSGADFELEKSTLEHVKDLLELFKTLPVDPEKSGEEAKQASSSKSLASRLKKDRAESVLDGRRAQAISIAMKKLKIHPEQPAKFTWALREMNESVLSKQAVEVLMSCPLWPISDEEMSALKTKSESGGKLAEPDKLILFVIDTVPDVVTRVNAMAFRWEFEDSLIEAVKAVGDIRFAAKSVLAHNNLKVVIRSAILVGNAINEESGRHIKGCTLSSLLKLGTTKTIRDKTSTALDLVAGYCLRCYPDFSSLADLIPVCMAAKKIELESQIKAIRDMRRGIDAIKKMKQLETFSMDAMRRLDIVESEMDVTSSFYDKALAYFGIPTGETDSNVFFEQIFQLCELWNKCLVKKQKEVKSQAAAVLAVAAAKRAAEKAAIRAAERAEKEKQKLEEAEANKGKLKLTVQLKGFFTNRRKGTNGEEGPGSSGDIGVSSSPPRTPRGLRSMESAFNQRSPKGLRKSTELMSAGGEDGLSMPTRAERRTRKSIFQSSGGSAEVAVRPKGRKSIFWG